MKKNPKAIKAVIIVAGTVTAIVAGVLIYVFINNNSVCDIKSDEEMNSYLNYFIVVEKNNMEAELRKNGEEINNETWSGSIDGILISDMVKQKAWNEYVKFRTKISMAREENISLTAKEKNEVKRKVESESTRGDDRTKEVFFRMYGLNNKDEYQCFKLMQRLIQKLEKHIYEEIANKVSYEEEIDYYKNNQDRYTGKNNLIPFDEARLDVLNNICDKRYRHLLDEWTMVQNMQYDDELLKSIDIIPLGDIFIR